MRIADILRDKGDLVVTITPDATVRELLKALSTHRVGALIVSSAGGAVDGIVSERDVVRRLHSDGDAVLDSPVASIMTRELQTAGPETSLDDLMVQMTENRVRHIPVLREGSLVGIVSIGDVVKHRISELQLERDQLQAYITT